MGWTDVKDGRDKRDGMDARNGKVHTERASDDGSGDE